MYCKLIIYMLSTLYKYTILCICNISAFKLHIVFKKNYTIYIYITDLIGISLLSFYFFMTKYVFAWFLIIEHILYFFHLFFEILLVFHKRETFNKKEKMWKLRI